MEILKDKLPKHVYLRLESAEIDSLDYFLLKPIEDICNKTRLTTKEVTSLIKTVSEITLNCNPTTAFELKSQEKLWLRLYTGCPIIDKVLNGIPTRGITEIYGQSGTGKTQIGLHLSLQVQKLQKHGGLNGGAVYVCTEDSFPSKRFKQMSDLLPTVLKENSEKSYTDNVFVEHIQDIDQLKYCVSLKIPVLLSKTTIKLIIIDSIAAVFRYEENSDYIARTEDFRYLTTKLNSLSLHYNLAVICFNQVTADLRTGERPCLGLSWSTLIRKRIKLSRTNENITLNNQLLPIRTLKVVFCPETSVKECSFVITLNGINGVE